MAIFRLFSTRKKQKENPASSQYNCENLPAQLRGQIVHILDSSLGEYSLSDPYDIYIHASPSNSLWERIYQIVCRENGVFRLGNGSDLKQQCLNYIMTAEKDKTLDMVEIGFQTINLAKSWPEYLRKRSNITQSPDDAIEELNDRFQEHNIGFRFTNNQIMPMDSEYMHKEVIEPALNLLLESDFKGALDEFSKGYKHLREKNIQDAIVNVNNAFESTMKSICDKRGWKYDTNATAKKLIEICFQEGLIPDELQSQFSALRSTLESGLPVIRNNKAGHGQGLQKREVPSYLAFYAINLAASNIVFLINAYKSLK